MTTKLWGEFREGESLCLGSLRPYPTMLPRDTELQSCMPRFEREAMNWKAGQRDAPFRTELRAQALRRSSPVTLITGAAGATEAGTCDSVAWDGVVQGQRHEFSVLVQASKIAS